VFCGGLGSLLCVASAIVLPAFRTMFAEVGVSLPTSTRLLMGVPGWAWWTLSVLSLLVLSLKDRRVPRRLRTALNGLYAVLVVGAGVWIVLALFSPLCVLSQPL
jgi:type II secretory pathway component PulF